MLPGQCKCCQAGKAQGHTEGMFCRPWEGLLLSLRGSPWWVQPLPNWFPYPRSGALCSGLLILWLTERSHCEAVLRRMCLLQGCPEHPLITSCEETPPWQHGCCTVTTLLCGGSWQRCSGSAWEHGNSAWNTGAWCCIAGASGKSSSLVCETWWVNVKAVALHKSAVKVSCR